MRLNGNNNSFQFKHAVGSMASREEISKCVLQCFNYWSLSSLDYLLSPLPKQSQTTCIAFWVST